HLIELLPYAVLLYGAMNAFGLQGAAIAFGVRVLADLVLLEIMGGNLVTTTKLLGLPTVLLAIGFVAAGILSPFCLPWFAAAGLLLTPVFIGSWSVAPELFRGLVKPRLKWERSVAPGVPR